MERLNFEGPINSLSLGNVSLNFIRELIKKGVNLNLFPVAEKAEFGSFDNLDPEIRQSIIDMARTRFTNNYNPDIPVLKVWHINGSNSRVAKEQYLYTFYETDTPTEHEIGIVKSQNHVFFSSSEAADTFQFAGCHNVSHVPLGFDEDFNLAPTNKLKDTLHFGLIGKFEKRKNTREIIRCWTQLFGNKPGYQLTLLVGNPFYTQESFDAVMNEALGQRWSNVNVLPRLNTNTEVATVHKSIDIDLSGLCGNEGWGLPAFNSTCFGKVCPLGWAMGHKDWGGGRNTIKVEMDDKYPCYDGVFFTENAMFNQGNFYGLSNEKISKAISDSVDLFNDLKKQGLENKRRKGLIQKFSYSNSIDKILEQINAY